ncbi:MAG: N-acyl homoserine lactonase family protein [Solirubrobacterales bacterium]|nr:N-acyl homoserine lactonase family protein [Solirubrobacterales bacterium]
MSLEVKVLDLGDIELDTSFLVLAQDPGRRQEVPTFGFLITGGEAPVVVDTGFSHPEIMGNLGMKGWWRDGQGMERQLAKHGLEMADVRYVLHTHLHIDHAGYDAQFPLDGTTVVINRRELEYSASGLMGEQYPAEYVKHLIDRLHHPGALRLLDLEIVDFEEIIPGVRCEVAGGHTEGSMNVLVDTDDGLACICGDVVYDVVHQLHSPHLQLMELDPAVTGNHGGSKRAEKGAIRKALSGARFLLPAHDRPAVLERGRPVGRTFDSVPGHMISMEEWPGKLTREHSKAAV